MIKKAALVLIPLLLLASVVLTLRKEKPSSLPQAERSFLLGLVPNPANSPNSTFEDLVEAYEETGKIAEVGMVWVENRE